MYARLGEITSLDGAIAVTLAAHQAIGLKVCSIFSLVCCWLMDKMPFSDTLCSVLAFLRS